MKRNELIKIAKEMVTRPSRSNLTVNDAKIFHYTQRDVFRCEIGFHSDVLNGQRARTIFLDPATGEDISQHIGLNWSPKS